MLLSALAATSAHVADTRSRREKIAALAQCLSRLAHAEILIGCAYLAGELPQGRIGVGWAAVREASRATAAERACLTLTDVDRALDAIVRAKGKGSAAERMHRLHELMSRATAAEQDFLARLLTGELRQGALEGILIEAVARAASVPAAAVRRAAMVEGSLRRVAAAALGEGQAGLARFSLTALRPVQPMLAQPAEDVAVALDQLGEAAFEWKIDGVRVQVHKRGDEVRAYSRSLSDVSAAVPEIIDAVRQLPVDSLILDGEAIALHPDGTPYPFQQTMSRFGRRLEADDLRRAMPLDVFFFDLLLLNDVDLTGEPARVRFQHLARLLPRRLAVARLITDDRTAAEAFFQEALRRGHEGLMAKSPEAPYEAGSRGSAWLKIKQANTLDLVVVAAEWGSGRRHGWLSNLHLAAREPETGRFIMLGKTFKGMTDQLLEWQTGQLLARQTGRAGHVVHVRPELVVEIAFNEIQASNRYPGGLALRFARVKRYREDKAANQADTIDTVRSLYAGQLHRRAADTAAAGSR